MTLSLPSMLMAGTETGLGVDVLGIHLISGRLHGVCAVCDVQCVCLSVCKGSRVVWRVHGVHGDQKSEKLA